MPRPQPRRCLAGLTSTLAASVLALGGCQNTGGPSPLFGGPGSPATPDSAPTPLFGGSATPGAASNLPPESAPSPMFSGAPKRALPTLHAGNTPPKADPVNTDTLPKELNMVTMPPYTVAAPDILLIDSQRLIPLPPYRIEVLDSLYIRVPDTLSLDEDLRVDGIYVVEPDGTINLGKIGGAVRVSDLTTVDAERVIQEKIRGNLANKQPVVSVSLAQARGSQQVRGEHLVRPDGTVSLGLYGSVYVAGMTIPEVKRAVEAQLSKTLLRPEVSVDVSAYNSQRYYVITDFGVNGEQVVPVPITGNERVLDAVAVVGGLSQASSKRVWIARPAPRGTGDQILPVDWKGITRRGNTETNYQILPFDRVFVMAQPLVKVDNAIARTVAPVERLLGTALFGYTTAETFRLGANGGILGNNSGTTVNVAR